MRVRQILYKGVDQTLARREMQQLLVYARATKKGKCGSFSLYSIRALKSNQDHDHFINLSFISWTDNDTYPNLCHGS